MSQVLGNNLFWELKHNRKRWNFLHQCLFIDNFTSFWPLMRIFTWKYVEKSIESIINYYPILLTSFYPQLSLCNRYLQFGWFTSKAIGSWVSEWKLIIFFWTLAFDLGLSRKTFVAFVSIKNKLSGIFLKYKLSLRGTNHDFLLSKN